MPRIPLPLLGLFLVACGHGGGDWLEVTLSGELDGEPIDETFRFTGSNASGLDLGKTTTGAASTEGAYAYFSVHEDTPFGKNPLAVLALSQYVEDHEAYEETGSAGLEPTDGDGWRRGGLGLHRGFLQIGDFSVPVSTFDVHTWHPTGNIRRPVHVAGESHQLAAEREAEAEYGALLTAEVRFNFRANCTSSFDDGADLFCGSFLTPLEVQDPGPLPMTHLNEGPTCPDAIRELYIGDGLEADMEIADISQMTVEGAKATLKCRDSSKMDYFHCTHEDVVKVDGCRWSTVAYGGYRVAHISGLNHFHYWMRATARADDNCDVPVPYCKMHAYSEFQNPR